MTTERISLGRMQHPVRGFLHGGAAITSVAGLVVLIVLTSSDWPRLLSMIVFGVSLIALYTTSALYHSVPWRPRWKDRLQRADHSMIFLLVAGSYTPIAFNVLSGWWRWIVLGVVWGIALVGIAQKAFLPNISSYFSVPLQTVQGWVAIFVIWELVRRLPTPALLLLLLGGVLYTVGMVMLVTGWPKLFPRIFSHHELFHVFVVAASVSHFLLVLLYVVDHPRA